MRIAFIAISGVRVCDDELMRLGMTLPGFIERSKVIASLPSLGLLTLAGMTPRRHDRVYLEIDDVRGQRDLPDAFDLVAISSYTAQIREAYELADRYRERGTPVVIGGLHATVLPEEAARHADAVVIGEGEASWPRVVDDAERGRLAPVYRPEGPFELAKAVMPAFELLDIDRYNRLTVQTSRGCPFHCAFCASSVLLTDRYRQKPVEKVLAEVERIGQLWDRPFLEFADDNSLVNRRYWKELLPALAKHGVRWFAETDLSVHEDEELLGLMRESGCTEVLIGLESPVPDGLDGLELRANWKARRFPEYVEAIRRIQAHGIRVNGCFILGLDGHTPDVFEAVYDFVRRAELFDVQITILTPFPGTPLYGRLRREGRLLDETAWERCTLFDANYRPDPMSLRELQDGFRQLAVRLYSDEETRWRRRAFASRQLRV